MRTLFELVRDFINMGNALSSVIQAPHPRFYQTAVSGWLLLFLSSGVVAIIVSLVNRNTMQLVL